MDQLFLMIRDGYETADRVEVDYTGRGIPKSVAIDTSTKIADEERYYTVSLVVAERRSGAGHLDVARRSSASG